MERITNITESAFRSSLSVFRLDRKGQNSRGDRYLGMTAAMTQVPVPTALIGDAEGEHGEVVVLLGAVAELVGVGLEGLDDVAHT